MVQGASSYMRRDLAMNTIHCKDEVEKSRAAERDEQTATALAREKISSTFRSQISASSGSIHSRRQILHHLTMSHKPVTLVGATGFTGSTTLDSLLASTFPFAITTFSRKPLPPRTASSTSTFTTEVLDDLTQATKAQLCTPGGVYITCLGTTRATAGGSKQQEAIDLHLNRDLARKAKEDGAETVRNRYPSRLH